MFYTTSVPHFFVGAALSSSLGAFAESFTDAAKNNTINERHKKKLDEYQKFILSIR